MTFSERARRTEMNLPVKWYFQAGVIRQIPIKQDWAAQTSQTSGTTMTPFRNSDSDAHDEVGEAFLGK
jgi:hypothetical protein